MIEYQVQVFAVLRDAVGGDSWRHQATQALTAPELLSAFFRAHPQATALQDVTRLAVNHAFVTDPQGKLLATDELALIPPVSGG